MKITNLNIGTRLLIGFGIILLISIMAAGIGIWNMRAVAVATKNMTETPLVKERLVSDWYRNNVGTLARVTAIVRSSDPSLAPLFAQWLADASKSSNGYQKEVETLLTTESEKKAFLNLGEARKQFIKAREAAVRSKTAGNATEAMRIFEQEFLPAGQKYGDALRALMTIQRESIDANARAIELQYQDSLSLMLILIGLLVSFGAVCATVIARSIVKPLQIAVDVARRIADGDLAGVITVESKDETGQLMLALRDMNSTLLDIVGRIRSGTDAVAAASSEIADGNLELSSRTEQQASSLEETVSSMEEMTTTVKQNVSNARRANQMALSASQVAVKGGTVVNQVIETMGDINASSRQIVDIISVIDGIAFQTNILALNAAVEAARAGEQGRGFAVVASEVRNLAQRSATAAKEIKILIGNSVDKIDFGSKLVGQAGATMDEIVASVQQVTDIMQEITVASREQEAGIEQINYAISEIDTVTQRNAALVEEAAAAAASLQQQSASLAQVVSAFNLDQHPEVGNVAPISAPKAAIGYRSKDIKAGRPNAQRFKQIGVIPAFAGT